MNRKELEKLVREALKKELSLTQLKYILLKLRSGELMGLFEDAIISAIESKRAEHYQNTGEELP